MTHGSGSPSVLEGPVGQAQHRLGATLGQGIDQIDQGLLALAPADAVHTRSSADHLGEEGGVRPAKDGKDVTSERCTSALSRWFTSR